jgi:uncharacterized protein (TIGR00730 family)
MELGKDGLLEALFHHALPSKYLSKNEDLNEKRIKDAWQIFKIIAEFIEGFEKLSKIGPCVSIFGSARAKPGDPEYELAVEIAKAVGQHGYGIITGGGPGIMEAGNKGAQMVGAYSVGLCIDLPFEKTRNPYIDPEHVIMFHYFFVRKVMFVKYAQGFIVMPGGFGTLDELFESLTLIQTLKIDRFPIILVKRDFWKPLIHWIQDILLNKMHYISPQDMDLFTVVDTPEEVVSHLDAFYSKFVHSPNF